MTSQIADGAWRRAFIAAILAATAVFAAALTVVSPARSQEEVVVLVDGEPITSLDVQQRAKFLEMSTHKTPTQQQAVDSLIDQLLELHEAARYEIKPTDTDVNSAFDGVASNMGVNAQKLSQMLTTGGASPATLKLQLKAQMAWTNLVRGRYKASLEIPDTDIEAELKLHGQKADVGYEYILRPILMVVPPGSPDSVFASRKHDAELLRGRFSDCTSGVAFAQGLPEVAVRDVVYKSSSDLPQQVRDILDNTELGHLTPPEQTSEGIQMFAVCSKKESKTDTPAAKKLRDQMFEKKFGAKAKSYLADLRREAMIEYK
ncbi:MAG: SurA N-terminal domain-containing protein [Xanthobacteraceae bacterium]